MAEQQSASENFIEAIINEDLRSNKHQGKVHTRFPPEPNGYLHIGHAKAICLNFGLAARYAGLCNLRFDDTNPTKEETEYVDSIRSDVRWLGFDWGGREFYASDYFEQLYQFALELIAADKAYVCDLAPAEVRAYRGTLTEPGRESPFRNRSREENLDLFQRMRAGEFPDGSRTLRAKIDMASPNLNLRDPVLYRILHAEHHRSGNDWCIYPMYDYAHPLSDAIEGITHSICTLEFEDHRPLYDWVLDNVSVSCHPQQIEFARLNLTYTVMSKRRLRALVEKNWVNGWDDPRMPTISGFRRRGCTPAAIHDFCERIGVAKRNSIVDLALLEHCMREDLNLKAPRAMAVLQPLRLVIENYPEQQVEQIMLEVNPERPELGQRTVPFSRVIYIEQEDFREEAPRKYFRLTPEQEVRLKGAYIVKCTGFSKDPVSGEITEVRCVYDPESKSGGANSGRKVKGTLHWVSAAHAVPAEVRLYNQLFTVPNPGEIDDEQEFEAVLNPDSLQRVLGAQAEPMLAEAAVHSQFQFLRHGYFCVDPDSRPGTMVFNRTVSLRDTWAKIAGEKQGERV